MPTPQCTDAHCHLTDPRITSADADRVIAECAQAGIQRFILGGIDPQDWDRQVELASRHPSRIIKAFGLHPWWVHDHSEQQVEQALRTLANRLADCSALGETGLDGARDRLKTSNQKQQHAFEAQLTLAQQHAKPLVLHIVRAHAQALETLSRIKPSHGGLVHSFSGTWADAQKYLDLGLTLSISARITHPDAHHLRETVSKAPADGLVYETDAPDQPPYEAQPERATRVHTPLSLFKVVSEVSRIRSESQDQLLARSEALLERIFKYRN